MHIYPVRRSTVLAAAFAGSLVFPLSIPAQLFTSFWGMSAAYGVADDGSFVASYNPRIFQDDLVVLRPAKGDWSVVARGVGYGISRDAKTVVGAKAPGQEAFRWTRSEGAAGLGFIPDGILRSQALAVSGEGGVVAGFGVPETDFAPEALRWTRDGGMERLGLLPGSIASVASGVSDDGSTIVGVSWGNREHAFRWTAEEGMTALEPDHAGYTRAYAASRDGSVVAGTQWFPGEEQEIFRWTEEGGMMGLGSLADTLGAIPTGMSADGSTIVGYGGVQKPGFIWTEKDGMRDLLTVMLEDYQLTNLEGWSYVQPYAISANGRYIVGVGYNSNDPANPEQAFLLERLAPVPEPSTYGIMGSGALLGLILIRNRHRMRLASRGRENAERAVRT